VPKEIALRMIWDCWHCDRDLAGRVAEGAGTDFQQAKSLPPLPGKPPSGEKRPASTYTSEKPESSEPRSTVATKMIDRQEDRDAPPGGRPFSSILTALLLNTPGDQRQRDCRFAEMSSRVTFMLDWPVYSYRVK
jgi:hypothetical protein